MLSQLKNFVTDTFDTVVAGHRSRTEAKYDRLNVSSYLREGATLTSEERRMIQERWGKIVRCIRRGYDFYRGLKVLDCFNQDYLPSSYFFPYIEGILNPERWKHQLSHKSMIEIAYGVGVRHPRTILRTFGGVFLGEDYMPLRLEEAVSVIRGADTPLLYKPSTESEQGAGVRLINPGEFDDLYKEVASGGIFDSNADFVLQEPVEQSKYTSVFNSTSLNCMRITTLNLNGQVSVCSRAIKCGPKDSVVDNIGSGKRGVIVGIRPDGRLCDTGFYGNGERASGHNGVQFRGVKIANFHKVVEAAICLHEYVRHCKIIGWDIALDSNDEPVLIEGNVVYPGVSFEQMCSGPIFGDRTEEVIAYISDCQNVINRGGE